MNFSVEHVECHEEGEHSQNEVEDQSDIYVLIQTLVNSCAHLLHILFFWRGTVI